MFAAVGRFAFRQRWWVVGGWAVLLLAGLLLAGTTFDRLGSVDSLSPQAESVLADEQIKQVMPAGPIVFAVVGDIEPYDPAVVASVSQVATELRTVPGVVEVRDLYSSPGGSIGADNRSTLIQVELAEDLPEADLEAAEDAIRQKLHTIAAPSVLVGGDHLGERAFGQQAIRDLAVGEVVAFALLIVALIIVFGGALAASLPIAVAVVGVCGTLLVLLAVSTFTEVGDYSVNIVTLLGLGLAVDYALLIVARYREERSGGAAAEPAVEVAVDRAGRAVAISGLAVALTLAALAGFAEPLLASMAIGGAAVVALTTLLALTLVPALLGIAGDRIPPAGAETWVTRLLGRLRDRLPWPRPGAGAPRPKPAALRRTLLVRLTQLAQRQPAGVALAATLGMFVLALPLIGANFANSDARVLPTSVEERRAYDGYQRLFAQDQPAAVTVVATVDASSAEVRDYLNQLNQLPGVGRLDLRPDVPAGTVIIDLIPDRADQGAALARSIRTNRPAFPALVTGEAAQVLDYQDSIRDRLPLVVAVVVLVMVGLLYLLTRSVIVPIKAVLLATLTFIATLGVLVVVFQWGWGEPFLLFDSWGALDLTTPLLLFVFIFGLSMDYEVFLLARIREEYDARPDNDRAVLWGIARSGPVVTAAAVCITIVFLGFAVGGLVPLKEIGVGMAVAVLLDVTVVRGLLLPAFMSLLGELNWWPNRARLTSVRRDSDG